MGIPGISSPISDSNREKTTNFDKLTKAFEDLRAQNKTLIDNNHTLHICIQDRDNHIESLKKQLSDTHVLHAKDKCEFRHAVEGLRNNRYDLNQTIDDLKKDALVLNAKNESLAEEVALYKRFIEHSKNPKDRMTVAVGANNILYAIDTSRGGDGPGISIPFGYNNPGLTKPPFETEKQSLIEENSRLEKDIKRSEDRINSLLQQNSDLQHQLEELSDSWDKLTKRHQDLINTNREQAKWIETINADKNKLMQQVKDQATIVSENDSLKFRLDVVTNPTKYYRIVY